MATDDQFRTHAVTPSSFLLFSLAPFGLATLVLWFGAPMFVQCDRIAAPAGENALALEKDDNVAAQESAPKSRVDVIMHRRFLGVITMKRDTATDVVDGHSYVQSSRGSRSRGGDTGTVLALELRDGRTWKSPGAYSPAGTPPHEMASRIKAFIETPSGPSLRMWCMSWVCHLLAAPLLLIGLLFAFAGLNVLRKNLAARRPLNTAFRG